MKLHFLLPLALLIAGCEGATTMTHTFHNRTEDTLRLTAHFSGLPWYDTVDVVLLPDQPNTLYTYDMLGKCHECGDYRKPMLWLDTLELDTRTWLDYPTASDWITEEREGTSWIQFDHTLNIGVGMVE